MEENKKNMSEDLLPVLPENKTLGGISNFAIWFSCSMVTTVMLTGMYFIPEVSFGKAIVLILIGSLVGIIPLILIGAIGQKTGLVTMVAARATFGNCDWSHLYIRRIVQRDFKCVLRLCKSDRRDFYADIRYYDC